MGRFNVDDAIPLSTLIEVIESIINLGWGSPAKLALMPPNTLTAALSGGPQKGGPKLRVDTALLYADLPSASYLMLQGASEDAGETIRRLKKANMRNAVVPADCQAAIRRNRSP